MLGVGSSCGACKFLRRKCEDICIFAPYFSYDGADAHFSAVHKVFGASNVSKLLSHLPVYNRAAAATTVAFEAEARIVDPIRGCVSQILSLQQQVAKLQEEIDSLTAPMAPLCSSVEFGRAIAPPSMARILQCDHADGFESDIQELHPVYREAIERLEVCLLSDEQTSWEELSMHMSDLEQYQLLH